MADQREQELLAALKLYPKGTDQETILKHFKSEAKELLGLLNKLYAKNIVEFITIGTKLCFRAVNEEEAEKKGGLTNDEKIVYGYIKGEGNKGIWIKDIKRRSNLHQDAVNDAIKNMEKKGVIKCVKSIKNPTRKIYMLFNTVPSEEITGGAWYTDNDIDVTFINELAKIVMNFIEKKSFPSDGKEQNLLYSAGYQGYATTRDVANYLRQNKIVTVDLSMGEIQTIIDMLRFEGKIQRILKVGDSRLGQAVARVERRKRAAAEAGTDRRRKRIRVELGSSDLEDGTSSEQDDDEEYLDSGDHDEWSKWMYQAIRAVGSKGNSLTDVPCGTCPVVDFCKPGGPVNPDNCVYYNKWLEF